MNKHTREVLEARAENLRTRIQNNLNTRRSHQLRVDECSAKIHEDEAFLREIEGDLNG